MYQYLASHTLYEVFTMYAPRIQHGSDFQKCKRPGLIFPPRIHVAVFRENRGYWRPTLVSADQRSTMSLPDSQRTE